MLGTAGNLSARSPDGSLWITASGRPKGELLLEDFVQVHPDGTVAAVGNHRPSAETSIHQALYRCFPEAQACYHVHSVEANLVSRLVTASAVQLPALEMLKGLGQWDEQPNCPLPIFANHRDVSKIALEIEQYFTTQQPAVPALLIRDHGVTVWAETPIAARHAIELMEYLFRYMVLAHQSGISIESAPNQAP